MVWYTIMMGMLQGMWDDQMSRLWGSAPRHDVSPAAEPEDPAEGMSEMRGRETKGKT
jgi:hypothetical protein